MGPEPAPCATACAPPLQAVARKLTRLTSEAHNAKQRSRLVGADDADGLGAHGGKVGGAEGRSFGGSPLEQLPCLAVLIHATVAQLHSRP